jgi:site-specific recombinase XerD
VDLLTLLDDWHLGLRAANKAPRTIDAYVEAGTKFVKFLGDKTQANHRDIQRYLVHLANTPHQRTGKRVTDSYVAGHYRSLQQFFRWLEEEGEITPSPFHRRKPPVVPVKPVPLLDDSEVRRLLNIRDKRSQALLRVLPGTRGLPARHEATALADSTARGP